jgi:hypothetical protein
MKKIVMGSFLTLMLIAVLFHIGYAEAAFINKNKPYVCEDYYTTEYCQKQAAKTAAKTAAIEADKTPPSIANTSQSEIQTNPTYDIQTNSGNVNIPQIETTKDNTEVWYIIILSLFGILILALIIKYKFRGKKNTAFPPIHWLSEGGAINTISEADFQNNFKRFGWRGMEYLTGYLFEKKGYSSLVTQSTGDFGIDVEAKKGSEYLGIQVKFQGENVGFPDVAKTLGVAQKFTKTILISTKSGFTSQALEHAQNNKDHIELWDMDRFKKELRDNLIK